MSTLDKPNQSSQAKSKKTAQDDRDFEDPNDTSPYSGAECAGFGEARLASAAADWLARLAHSEDHYLDAC